jgi:hypothetical protein
MILVSNKIVTEKNKSMSSFDNTKKTTAQLLTEAFKALKENKVK